MSVVSDLKAIEDALAGLTGPSAADMSNEDIARRILHCLAASGGAEPTEEVSALIKAFGTDVETLRTDYDNYHAERRWKALEATGGPALTGTLRDMDKIVNPQGHARTRVTVQRTDHPTISAEQYQTEVRNQEIVSPEYERSRADNIGK